MKKPKTHVALILDKSGSMSSIAEAAISGFNENIQQMKAQAKDGHDIRCTVVSFNHDVTEHAFNEKVDKVAEITSEEYRPDGGTHMYDAMGYTLEKLQKLASEDRDTAFLVVVISDGDTYSDKHFQADGIKKMVTDCEKSGRWTVVYIGCSGINALRVAQATGISAGNMASVDFSDGHTYAKSLTRGINENSRRYFSARSMGATTIAYCAAVGGAMDENGVANWAADGGVGGSAADLLVGSTVTTGTPVVVDKPKSRSLKS